MLDEFRHMLHAGVGPPKVYLERAWRRPATVVFERPLLEGAQACMEHIVIEGLG